MVYILKYVLIFYLRAGKMCIEKYRVPLHAVMVDNVHLITVKAKDETGLGNFHGQHLMCMIATFNFCLLI